MFSSNIASKVNQVSLTLMVNKLAIFRLKCRRFVKIQFRVKMRVKMRVKSDL